MNYEGSVLCARARAECKKLTALTDVISMTHVLQQAGILLAKFDIPAATSITLGIVYLSLFRGEVKPVHVPPRHQYLTLITDKRYIRETSFTLNRRVGWATSLPGYSACERN